LPIRRKLDQLIFAGWTHQPAEDLARALVTITGLPYAFFSDPAPPRGSGAENGAGPLGASRRPQRQRIIVMQHSYHGDTIGAMSVGERGVYNAAYAPLLFDVETVPFPTRAPNRPPGCAGGRLRRARCRRLHRGAADPGAGGMLIYPPHVLAEMAAICRRHGVLIADEVMTGWGRTGTLLACEQAGVAPDILCLAKGLTGGAMPLAVTLASEAIYDAHYSTDRARTFYHSSSYTANPIACAAACANLAIWREEPVEQRIAALAAGRLKARPCWRR
jgi:adenosylmethionine-8-amino-7-oxononanoate aminotransferase